MGVFVDFEKKAVMLSGYEMPIMDPDAYSISDEECYYCVSALLEGCRRLIDS